MLYPPRPGDPVTDVADSYPQWSGRLAETLRLLLAGVVDERVAAATLAEFDVWCGSERARLAVLREQVRA